MYLVTEGDYQYVMDCEELVLKQLAKVTPGLIYKEIDFVCTESTRVRLRERRAQLLADTDLESSFPDMRQRKYPKDPLIAQALRELEEEL